MKDAGNPTRWQVAGLALAATVIVAGLALAQPLPRLAANGEPGGVVRTVEDSPHERARLAQLVRQAEAKADRDEHEQPTGAGSDERGEADTADATDDEEPTPAERARSEEDAPVEHEPVPEEDPPTLGGDDDGDEDSGGGDGDGD